MIQLPSRPNSHGPTCSGMRPGDYSATDFPCPLRAALVAECDQPPPAEEQESAAGGQSDRPDDEVEQFKVAHHVAFPGWPTPRRESGRRPRSKESYPRPPRPNGSQDCRRTSVAAIRVMTPFTKADALMGPPQGGVGGVGDDGRAGSEVQPRRAGRTKPAPEIPAPPAQPGRTSGATRDRYGMARWPSLSGEDHRHDCRQVPDHRLVPRHRNGETQSTPCSSERGDDAEPITRPLHSGLRRSSWVLSQLCSPVLDGRSGRDGGGWSLLGATAFESPCPCHIEVVSCLRKKWPLLLLMNENEHVHPQPYRNADRAVDCHQ